MAEETAGWLVYMIRCCDGSYYTGITTDLERRVRQHGEGRGAKYFRGRQPREVVYLEAGHDRRSAGKREVAIKRLSRREKERLVAAASKPSPPSPPLEREGT